MGWGFCHNESDHIREGRNDYERRGYPDRDMYDDPFNDCSRYYKQGFDEAKREEEREQERREERRQEEAREHREQQYRADMRRQEEEELYNQMEADYLYKQQQNEIQDEQYFDHPDYLIAEHSKIEPTISDDLPF